MDFTNRRADLELVRRACDVLLKIPGVFSVGLGSKLIGGRNTGQLSLSVMVLEKKAASALAPHEVIPAEIEGLPTDVIEGRPPHLIEDEEQEDFDPGVSRDRELHRPIVGGIQVRGERSKTRKDGHTFHTFGTLGGFAITQGKDAGKHVLLTNYHVLADEFSRLYGPSCTGCTKGDTVGNPNAGDGIATVLRGSNGPQLDAAIAILDTGVEFERDIIKDDAPFKREAIGVSRPLDPTNSSDRDIVVHKRGHRTLITYGVVGAIGATTPEIENKTKENQIRIDLPRKITGPGVITFEAGNTMFVPSVDFVQARVQKRDIVFVQGLPNAGRYRITEVVDAHRIVVAATSALKESTGTHGFFVTPPIFALKGDSGSLLLDEQGKVVGLVWAGNSETPFGNAWANRIDVVERELRIKIDPASAIGDTQVVARIESGDLRARVEPVEELSRPAAARGADAPMTLRESVEHDLLPLPRGRAIYDLYFRHHMEVRELLDTNRRVALVWHRQGGPGIIQSVLDAVRSRDSAIPSTVRGKRWADRVKAILAIFAEHGSPQLRRDIASFGADVAGLGGMTYPRFLSTLGA